MEHRSREIRVRVIEASSKPKFIRATVTSRRVGRELIAVRVEKVPAAPNVRTRHRGAAGSRRVTRADRGAR